MGDGVAAWCIHFYLKNTGLKVINISEEDFFGACSRSSTAINCLRGTTPGKTPLGDTIIESMEEFLRFNKSEKPVGIYEGFEYQILETETISKWERRYPEFHSVVENKFLAPLIKSKNLFHKVSAHFINIPKFEQWIKSQAPDVEVISDLVLAIESVDDKYVVQTRNKKIAADIVVLCTGSATHLLTQNTSEKFKYYIDHSKQVTGGYLELQDAKKYGLEWEESFVLAIEKYHFIYRKDEDIVQIGSSSKNNDALELPLTVMLRSIYDHIDKFISFKLPEFEEFKLITGVRHKGHLRRPYWGVIDDKNLFAICGLYKNAFSFSFKAAKDLANQISSQ